MLRIKLFKSFAALILLFGLVSGWFVIRTINQRIVAEAQDQVRLNLGSAWFVLEQRLDRIETVLSLEAGRHQVVAAGRDSVWSQRLRDELEQVRTRFDLDFLGVVDAEGLVVLRAAPPYKTGDSRRQHAAVEKALRGEVAKGADVFSRVQLEVEADGLVERAFIVYEDTPHARPSAKSEETRGMVLMAAVPIRDGPQVLGVLYAGVLVNRNHDMIDHIRHVIYKDEEIQGVPIGTATIFLEDSRVTTTVQLANGNRALGTRVSKEVADRVLDNGRPWVGRAFVVKDWYLTAYEPIRDFKDRIIGMFYVGILEEPFRAMGQSIIWRYVQLILAGVLVALVASFFIAGRLARPIHRLVDATHQVEAGHYPEPVTTRGGSTETQRLTRAFNLMTKTIRDREASLNKANRKVNKVNRNYMEILSFLTHELNTPVSTMMNYVYLLRTGKLGNLSEKQFKAVGTLDHNIRRISEMTRHYLNLARIERDELNPSPSRIDVMGDVVGPLLDAFEPRTQKKDMTVENRLPDGLRILADLNMTREVFENLFSNAVKYGREQGYLRLEAEQSNGFVHFRIRNAAEGMGPEKLVDLFEKFSRVENLRGTRRERGTGLGLFISRQIVQKHGGEIHVQSRENEWVEFDFTLPGIPVEEPVSDKPTPERGAGDNPKRSTP